VLGLAFLVSVIVRWPLAGVTASSGDGRSWRDPGVARPAWASLLWTLVFAARLVVKACSATPTPPPGSSQLGMGPRGSGSPSSARWRCRAPELPTRQ
jgi:hypothetical protein